MENMDDSDVDLSKSVIEEMNKAKKEYSASTSTDLKTKGPTDEPKPGEKLSFKCDNSKVQAVPDGKTPDTGSQVQPVGGATTPASGSQDLSRHGGKKGGGAKHTTSILKKATDPPANMDTDDDVIFDSVVQKGTKVNGRSSRKRSRSRSKSRGNPNQQDKTEQLISSVQQLVMALNNNTNRKDRSRSASRQNNSVQGDRGKSQSHRTQAKSTTNGSDQSPAHSRSQSAKRKKTRIAPPLVLTKMSSSWVTLHWPKDWLSRCRLLESQALAWVTA